jgi:hypothetical protein
MEPPFCGQPTYIHTYPKPSHIHTQVGLNVIRPTYSPRYIFEMTRGKK